MCNPDDYEDLTPKTVKRARAGNRNAALRVLDIFRAAVADGENPHPDVMRYLAEAFSKILDEDEPIAPERALGLARGRGERKSIEERDFDIVVYLDKRLADGRVLTQAIGDAVNHFDWSEETMKRAEETMKRAYRKWQGLKLPKFKPPTDESK